MALDMRYFELGGFIPDGLFTDGLPDSKPRCS